MGIILIIGIFILIFCHWLFPLYAAFIIVAYLAGNNTRPSDPDRYAKAMARDKERERKLTSHTRKV